MANTIVTKVGEMLLANVTAGVKTGEQKVSEAAGFSEVMNNAKDTTAKVDMTKSDDNTKATRTVVETPKSKEIVAEEPVKKDPLTNESDMKELTEEVAEEVATIVNKIKEVLNVSDEEISEAMETLGITPASLIDPANVKDLLMEITDTPDSITLLTNADLYENIKEIVQTAEDATATITAQFDLTEDQALNIFKDESFKDAVEDAITILQNRSEADELQPNEAVATSELKIDDQMPKPDTDVENNTEVITPSAEKSNTDTNVAVNNDTATKTVTVEVNREADTKPVTDETVKTDDPLVRTTTGTTETFKAAAKPEESSLKGNNEGFEHASRFAETEAAAAAPQQTTVVTTEVNNLGQVVETVTTYSNEQANSIMSQVTESIRVNYTADTTSMELQLHPASLGTVNMQIASTNGVVTAHILVENEAVKAALESQLITLQQTFDEAGTKVEAVEVAVANYDLNRGSGSETGSNSGEQASGRSSRIGSRRRINLNDLADEDLEELDEDEKLAADMMARSGNTMDYRA